VANSLSENRTARKLTRACGPPGGLFGIDQEVVTLRGLYGNSGFRHFDDPDRPASGGINPLLTGSVRAVASGVAGRSARSTQKPRLERPALSLSHLTWSLGTSTTAF